MAAKLKKGDKVVVLAGKDKGKQGTISSIDPKAGKAVVDGLNIAIRATRQVPRHPRVAASQRRCQSALSNLASAGCKRQSHTRWLQNGWRQQSAFCQDNRGCHLMADYTPRLKLDYVDTIRAAMKEEFGYKNDMQIPRLDKIVLNIGAGAEAVETAKKPNPLRKT